MAFDLPPAILIDNYFHGKQLDHLFIGKCEVKVYNIPLIFLTFRPGCTGRGHGLIHRSDLTD